MKRVSAVKHTFTEEDVYERARASLESCVLNGTTHMRTHVEIDPNAGMNSFYALEQLAKDYAWAIDLDLCVFIQEGLAGVPGADETWLLEWNAAPMQLAAHPVMTPTAARKSAAFLNSPKTMTSTLIFT
jgi:cytosine/adenosine deaminase-related metal-dependent hydrolase